MNEGEVCYVVVVWPVNVLAVGGCVPFCVTRLNMRCALFLLWWWAGRGGGGEVGGGGVKPRQPTIYE